MVSGTIWPQLNLNRLDAEKLFQRLMSHHLKPLLICAVSQCIILYTRYSLSNREVTSDGYILLKFLLHQNIIRTFFVVNYKYEEYSALFNTFPAEEVKNGDSFEVTFDRTMRTPPYLIGKLSTVRRKLLTQSKCFIFVS